MIVNPEKLPVIFPSKTDNSVPQKLNICNNNTETTNLVKLLGIEIDHPLKFNQRISTLCFMAAVELNALSSLQQFIGKAKKGNNKNKQFYSFNFNYCLFLVHASLPEKLKTFIPSLELDAYNNDYEALIKKDGTFTMKIEKLRVLATEILKKINYINPSYIKNICIPKANAKVHQNDTEFRYHKTTSYEGESLNILGPKKWNHHLTYNSKHS